MEPENILINGVPARMIGGLFCGTCPTSRQYWSASEMKKTNNKAFWQRFAQALRLGDGTARNSNSMLAR